MKQFLFIVFILLGLYTDGVSQNVSLDAQGNFYAVNIKKERPVFTDTVTNKIYTSTKGIEYPVFVSRNQKYYIWKTSIKTGNRYKHYLKVE